MSSYFNIKGCLFLLLIVLSLTQIKAQQFLNFDKELNLRFEKENYSNQNLHTCIKPFMFTDSLSSENFTDNSKDEIQKSIFYKLTNENIFNLQKRKFQIKINPIISLLPKYITQDKSLLNNYLGGLKINGGFGSKVTFDIAAFYGIQEFPVDIQNRIDTTQIIPGYGKYLVKNDNSFHYYHLNAYLSYSPWKHLNLQGGVGKNFFGDGYRSLFLSGNSNSYPYIKATVDIRKLKYVWMFSSLKERNSDELTAGLQNKHLFTHYLSWNATKWLNLNFFESIIANPVDSVGVSHFNINYLNPVIFFRPVEFAGGSADNAILGFGGKIKILKKYHFYAQCILDEFMLSEITSGNNWWGNKYGVQTGLKTFDLIGIKNLFARLEFNLIRPFTYSYSNNILNYGNYRSPLAHPTGANVTEVVGQLHYNIKRYSFEIKAVKSKAGMDYDDTSYGQDIYKLNTLRSGDYEHHQGQGFKANYSFLGIKAAYLINPKINLKFQINISHEQSHTHDNNHNRTSIQFGVSQNIGKPEIDYLR